MIKRSFWLMLAAGAAWWLWNWGQQRRNELLDPTPQFAPPRPFTPPASAPANNDQVAPVDVPPPADVPTAPPPVVPTDPGTFAPADNDQVMAVEPELPSGSPDEAQTVAAETAPASSSDTVLGYCMRCRTKRPIQHVHFELSENGRHAARGTCPVCGAKMFTFLSANDEQGAAS